MVNILFGSDKIDDLYYDDWFIYEIFIKNSVLRCICFFYCDICGFKNVIYLFSGS